MLNYLSEAAGFVIIQNVPVTGTVNVVSKQPVNAEEAVDLLNTVLVTKGYIAVRNGRILKIVSSKDAQKNDLPVEVGSDPQAIPRKDAMVTQILPIRYMDASKLVDNLSPRFFPAKRDHQRQRKQQCHHPHGYADEYPPHRGRSSTRWTPAFPASPAFMFSRSAMRMRRISPMC